MHSLEVITSEISLAMTPKHHIICTPSVALRSTASASVLTTLRVGVKRKRQDIIDIASGAVRGHGDQLLIETVSELLDGVS